MSMMEEEISASHRVAQDRRGPPWWVVILVGMLATASISVAGYSAQAAVRVAVDVNAHELRLGRAEADVRDIRDQVRAVPSRIEVENLRTELRQVREDIRELRDDLRRRGR